MGKKAVSVGAVLSCRLGTKTSKLRVPETHGVTTQGRNQANICDYEPYENIPDFGSCKRSTPPPACTPAIVMKWLKGQQDCVLDNDLALLEDCIVPCCFGGVISIVESGQK